MSRDVHQQLEEAVAAQRLTGVPSAVILFLESCNGAVETLVREFFNAWAPWSESYQVRVSLSLPAELKDEIDRAADRLYLKRHAIVGILLAEHAANGAIAKRIALGRTLTTTKEAPAHAPHRAGEATS
jgi:hypothetical protein